MVGGVRTSLVATMLAHNKSIRCYRQSMLVFYLAKTIITLITVCVLFCFAKYAIKVIAKFFLAYAEWSWIGAFTHDCANAFIVSACTTRLRKLLELKL